MTITFEDIASLVENPAPEKISAYDAGELACAFSANLPALLAESTDDNDLVEMLFDFWETALATPAAPAFADAFFEEDEHGFRRINMLKPARCNHAEWYRGIRRTMDAIEELRLAPYQMPKAEVPAVSAEPPVEEAVEERVIAEPVAEEAEPVAEEDADSGVIYEFCVSAAEEDDPDMLISAMFADGSAHTERLPHSMVSHSRRIFDGGDSGVAEPRDDVFYVISERDLFELWRGSEAPDQLDLFEDAPAKLYSYENDVRTLSRMKMDNPGYRVIV